jgi:hypothetical protein
MAFSTIRKNVEPYMVNSTDIAGSAIEGLTVIGTIVYVVDTGQTYIVNNNRTLSPYTEVTIAPASSTAVTQDVIADPLNSFSGSGLASGAIYSGCPVSTLGVAGIQVSLFTDQNCTVYVEQSPDSINWDISDAYNYHTSVNNFGITVQAINSYYRVRVLNDGINPVGVFRLQSVLCPIVESVPRSLTVEGNLKTAVRRIEDRYGFAVENTPNDEMRVITPYRLVGATFSGSVVDSNFWTTGSGSGSIVATSAQVILTSSSYVLGNQTLQSVRSGRYIGGSSNRARMVVRLPDTGSASNIRRWGAFTTTDGAFFELNGTTLKTVTRKTSVDLATSSGSFNGTLGKAISVPTNVNTWEIYYNNSKVYFGVGGEILHTMSASSTTWTDTLHLPIRFENLNSGALSSNLQMNIRNGIISRMGSAASQPTSYYFASGQSAGVTLKIGPGNLHSIIVNSGTNGAVITLADSANAATPVITAMTVSPSTTTPYTLDLKGLPFYTGLRLIVASQNASLTLIYE